MKKNKLGRTGYEVSAIAYGGIVSTMGGYANYGLANLKKGICWRTTF